MSIATPDALVGAIALEFILKKLRPQLDDDPDFRGAFHVLSGFSPAQLVGFIQAKEAAGVRSDRLHIQFPRSELVAYDVDPSYTTPESSVNVRNRERNGSVILTAEVENDAEASLADSDRTDASDLRTRELADIWVDFVARNVGLALLPEERKKAEAMVKGLFDTGRCPTSKAGEFLTSVLAHYKSGEVFTRAAGKALPIIGLPLFEDCFSALSESKMAQPSQWAAKFKSHYQLECYLDKRGLAQEVLETEVLRRRLIQLQSPEQQPPIPEGVLTAFHDYAESEGARNAATERLLFDFDWAFTTHCFDRTRKTSGKDFAERTRSALEAEGLTPTADDELVIHALSRLGRKSGTASDEFREFFENRSDALEKDPALYLEWEDFVHGKRIECIDLFQGIFECIQRAVRGLAQTEPAYVVLEGRQQKKPNSFLEMNQRACEYFERSYGSLELRSKKRIRFDDTLICTYSRDVLEVIRSRPRFKGGSKSAKATTLTFLVSVFQKQAGRAERTIATLSLAWKFPIESVLAQESADIDAICRYHAQRGTTMVECVAEYEVVGRKGLPVSLSLESVEGFADVARGGGRGAFVPAQGRIRSVTAQWKETLDTSASRRWLPSDQVGYLHSAFTAFAFAYDAALLGLRRDSLATETVAEVAAAYRRLLLAISQLRHHDARRQLLRIALKVGLAQVQRSGRRPPMAVICPWHPLRMEATAARQKQALGLIEQLLGKERPP